MMDVLAVDAPVRQTPAAGSLAVRLEHVTKSFGARKVLDDVSLDVPSRCGFHHPREERHWKKRHAPPHHRPHAARQRPRIRRGR